MPAPARDSAVLKISIAARDAEAAAWPAILFVQSTRPGTSLTSDRITEGNHFVNPTKSVFSCFSCFSSRPRPPVIEEVHGDPRCPRAEAKTADLAPAGLDNGLCFDGKVGRRLLPSLWTS